MLRSIIVFVLIFAVSGIIYAQTSCTLEDSILDIDAEIYFAFKGVGEIVDPNDSNPDSAWAVYSELAGIEGRGDFKYSDYYVWFFEDSLLDPDETYNKWVEIELLADPDQKTIFKTLIRAAIPVKYLKYMMNENINWLPIAPFIDIRDITLSKDRAYVKYCSFASNKNGEPDEEFGETAIGKFQVCFDNNTDFSAGEKFNIVMSAELVIGEDILGNYDNAETLDDLCKCYETKENGNAVDCSTIDWGSNNDDPENQDTDSDMPDDDNSAGNTEETATDNNDASSENNEDTEENTSDNANKDNASGKEESKSDGCSMLFI